MDTLHKGDKDDNNNNDDDDDDDDDDDNNNNNNNNNKLGGLICTDCMKDLKVFNDCTLH